MIAGLTEPGIRKHTQAERVDVERKSYMQGMANLANKIWADLEALDNFYLKILELYRHESEALDEKFSADLSILLDRQAAGLQEFDDRASSGGIDPRDEIANRFLREEHELRERFLVEKCEFAKRVFNSHRDEFHVFLREHPAAAAVREGTA